MPSIAVKVRTDALKKIEPFPGHYLSDKIENLVNIKTAVPIETVKKALREVIKEDGRVTPS